MTDLDLSDLLGGKSEDPSVEYKAWMDTSTNEAKAKLAKHIAALANHGGGYLVFGVEDSTREPLGETTFDRANFSQRRLAEIAERYLDPAPHIDVDEVGRAGVRYPIASIVSHGERPVIASRDGPQDKGSPIGIRQGEIYVRVAGPKSVRATTADHWGSLIERCIARRADLMAKVMRQAIARPSKPSREAIARLVEFTEATRAEFVSQLPLLAVTSPAEEQNRILLAKKAHCALAYTLVDGAGDPIELANPRSLVQRAAVGMRQVALAADEWHAFIPLTHWQRAPQMQTISTAASEVTFLEGMKPPNAEIVGDVVDYWRIYEAGVAVCAQSYREDYIAAKIKALPYLTIALTLRRLHSLLAHARFVGEETPGVEQVAVRMDWRGLAGRPLLIAPHEDALGHAMTTDALPRTIIVNWAELRDRYFDALKRIALPFFDAFPNGGFLPPEQWLTREFAEVELQRVGSSGRVRLL